MTWLKYLQKQTTASDEAAPSAMHVDAPLDAPLDQGMLVAAIAILCKRYGNDGRVVFTLSRSDRIGPSTSERVCADIEDEYTLESVKASLRHESTGSAADASSPRLHVAVAGPAGAEAQAEPPRRIDLLLRVRLGAASSALRLEACFDEGLYRRQSVEDFLYNTATLLREISHADERQPLDHLPLLAPDQVDRVLASSRGPEVVAPFVGIIERFERMASLNPDAVALRTASERLTYRELDRRATVVARCLTRAGVHRGSRVVVCLARDASLLVGLLGVLRAGAAYVAVEPTYPRERINFILEDTAAALVLIDAHAPTPFPEHVPVLRLDQVRFDEPAGRAEPRVTVTPEDIAYILYTSGSTGTPKGVVVGHDNLDHFLGWSEAAHGLGVGDVAVATTSILFDVSVCDLWSPLISGATLYLLRKPTDVFDLPDVTAIALLCAVPSSFNSVFGLKRLLGPDSTAPKIRVLNLAGEALEEPLARAILERVKPTSLRNCYGPTEATVYATWAEVDDPAAVTIGRPLLNMRAFVIDARGNLMPPGMPGELALGGAGVTRGYLNRADLTRQCFVRPRFAPELRLYRTGDLVRVNEDGLLQFIGRADHQIKLNGYRIELGEVEATILKRTEVTECAVFVLTLGRRGSVLVACFHSATGETPAQIIRKLSPFLTEYMIPTEWVALESFPYSVSGKVDRVSLRATAEERLRASPGLVRTPVSGSAH